MVGANSLEPRVPPRSIIAFGLAILLLFALGLADWRVLGYRRESTNALQHALSVRQGLTQLDATVTQAESAQRGFLVTGDPAYLGPYTRAAQTFRPELARVRADVAGEPELAATMDRLAELVEAKMDELARTVGLAQAGQREAAIEVLAKGQGLREMEELRGIIAQLRHDEEALFAQRRASYDESVRLSIWTVIGGSVVQVLLMLVLAGLSLQDFRLHDELLRRETFLRDAAVLLSSSLDYQHTLRELAKLAVPAVADWCAIDMLDEHGEVRRLAVEHLDPAKVQLAHELWRKLPPDPKAPTGFFHVLKTGQPEVFPQVTEEMIDQALPDPELRQTLRALGLRSSIAVPLIARGRALGVLSLVTAESGRHYSEFDVVSAQKLARLAALAVDNARLYSESQEASRLKDEFLSTVSHELRTPLTAMLGWSHMLTRQNLPAEKQAQAAAIIERNARAQAQLIEDLLDVSRIISGKLRLDVRPVNLVEVIEAALQSVQPAADGREIRLQKLLDPNAGAISGDPDRLQQVIWNLLSNAIKFTPKGGRVAVQLARVNSHVEVTVSDTGEGIHPEFLPHVFERFRQEDASAHREHQGLGLGLAITKHLVELHGGTIHASSEGPGKGATFVVKLPRFALREDPAAEPSVHPTAATAAVAWTEPPALAGAKVLVVDDQPDTCALIAEVLGRCKAEVATANDAATAEGMLARQKFDLLISDIGMPGRDGFALIQSVRALPDGNGELPAVAVTAYARAEDRSRALRSGFDAHVAKPLEPGELVEVASALLRRRGAR